MTIGRAVGLAVAVLMVAVGAVWTAQGLDLIGGSSMSGDSTWAAIGPVVAGLGVALVIVVVQSIRRSRATKGRVGEIGRAHV